MHDARAAQPRKDPNDTTTLNPNAQLDNQAMTAHMYCRSYPLSSSCPAHTSPSSFTLSAFAGGIPVQHQQTSTQPSAGTTERSDQLRGHFPHTCLAGCGHIPRGIGFGDEGTQLGLCQQTFVDARIIHLEHRADICSQPSRSRIHLDRAHTRHALQCGEDLLHRKLPIGGHFRITQRGFQIHPSHIGFGTVSLRSGWPWYDPPNKKGRTQIFPLRGRLSVCASVSGSTVRLGQDRLSGVQAMRLLGHRDGTHAMPGMILRQPFFTAYWLQRTLCGRVSQPSIK